MTWNVEFTDEFGEWWENLTEIEQDEIYAKVGLLVRRDPLLRFPVSDVIESSKHFPTMRELRVSAQGRQIRIFYAFDPRSTAILLIGGDKTGEWERFYRKMIPVADELYDVHLEEIRRNE